MSLPGPGFSAESPDNALWSRILDIPFTLCSFFWLGGGENERHEKVPTQSEKERAVKKRNVRPNSAHEGKGRE